MKRKIIQIAGVGDSIYALDNKGTVWIYGYNGNHTWMNIPELPEEDK